MMDIYDLLMDYLRVIDGWLKEKVANKLGESQYGFRPGRGTVDAIFRKVKETEDGDKYSTKSLVSDLLYGNLYSDDGDEDISKKDILSSIVRAYRGKANNFKPNSKKLKIFVAKHI